MDNHRGLGKRMLRISYLLQSLIYCDRDHVYILFFFIKSQADSTLET